MKTLLGACSAALALSFASFSFADDPHFPPWGFDLAGRDTSVAPGARLLRLRRRDLCQEPADPARPRPFRQFRRAAGAVRRPAARPAREGRPPISDRHAATRARSAPSIAPIWTSAASKPWAPGRWRAELAQIRAADSRQAIAALMGRARSFFGSVFETEIGADAKDPDALRRLPRPGAAWACPTATTICEPSFAAQKAAYQAYVAQMLDLVDWPDADGQRRRPSSTWKPRSPRPAGPIAEDRDPTKTYNPMTPQELATAAPGFDWTAFLARRRPRLGGSVVVAAEHRLAQDRQDLRRHAGRDAARPGRRSTSPTRPRPTCPTLRRRALRVPQQDPERPAGDAAALEARACGCVNAPLGEAVGKLYVARHTSPPRPRPRWRRWSATAHGACAARIEHARLDERRRPRPRRWRSCPCSTSRSAIRTNGATIRRLQIDRRRPLRRRRALARPSMAPPGAAALDQPVDRASGA